MSEIKLLVTFHIKDQGFAQAIVNIDSKLANRLKGKKVGKTKIKDCKYWDVVRLIKEEIALRLGIKLWHETFYERTDRGDTQAPINIISIQDCTDAEI